MRRVDRSSVDAPLSLGRKDRGGQTELQRATTYMANPAHTKSYDFERYKDAEVKEQLERLFHGKCAYCESFYAGTQPVDVEHYRPKGEIEEVAGHRGYWWLAMDWENLLPSCIDCNRRRRQRSPLSRAGKPLRLIAGAGFSESEEVQTGKASSFPLATEAGRAQLPADALDREKRLLIDPTRDDPAAHLSFNLDNDHTIGLVLPIVGNGEPALLAPHAPPDDLLAAAASLGVSAMGLVSIQVYGLNRLGLVQARTRVLRELEFLVELTINLSILIEDVSSHISAKRSAVGEANIETQAAIHAEINFNERIGRQLRQFYLSIVGEIKKRTSSDAPYSEMAKAWVAKYLED